MEITLRSYQQEIVDSINKTEKRGIKRQLVVMSTGTGKSFTAVFKILQEIKKNKKVLILVDQSDLVWQWKNYLQRVDNSLHIGIEKAEYRAKKTDQVVIATVQTLGRKGVKRIKRFDPNHFSLAVSDEAHKSIADTWFRVLEYFGFGKDSFNKDNLLIGLSVAPNSNVSVKGGVFGTGQTKTIESVWNKTNGNVIERGNYEIKSVKNIKSRGWNTNNFCWKNVENIIRHPVKEEGTKIRTTRGTIETTNDHSVYLIENGNIVCKKSDKIKKGDVLLIDNGVNFEEKNISTIHDILNRSKRKFFVKTNVKRSDVEIIDSKNRSRYFNKNSLPYKYYRNFGKNIEEPTYIYYEGSTKKTLYNLDIKQFSYLFGFWLGDGWFREKSGLGFSIKNDEVEYFVHYLNTFTDLDLGIEIKNNGSGAKDVCVYNVVLREIFDFYFKGQGHNNKTIHNEIIYNYPKKYKKQLISGLIDSDGYIKKKNKRNKKATTIVTTSSELANSLRLLLQTLNIDGKYYTQKPALGGVINGRQIKGTVKRYDVKFSLNSLRGNNEGQKGNRKRYEKINCIEAKVLNVEKIELNNYVYDFEMNGHPSFVANNILVHNTATPFRSTGESLGILYDDIVANKDLSFAIGEGWLTDFELYEVSTNTNLTNIKSQKEIDIHVDNEDRNATALKTYQEYSKGEQALIYCASVDHAHNLCKVFNDNNVPSAVIEANTPKDERKQILQDFKDKKIRCIQNFSTMTTGVDLPETSTLMLLRPVQSKLLITQILGRGLRPSSTAFVDVFDSAEKRKGAIQHSAKPHCKVIDFHDKVANQNFAHIPSLFGLNNGLKTNKPKKFFKEVVEPLEEKAKEHGFDKTKIKNLDEIELIVKNRTVNIQSLKTDPEIEQFTDRNWISTSKDSYEIIYSDDNKILMIEADQSKDQLLGKKEWNLLEYDIKDQVTKKLQTFNSISGAFKIADEYADKSGFYDRFKKRAEWMESPPSEKQIQLLNKLYTYKSGYSEFRTLNERYSNGHKKLFYKKTGETINKGTASKLIELKFSN